MIILNLIVSGKEDSKAITRYLLQSKYAVQVIMGHPLTFIELDVSGVETCTDIHNILFVTKAVLFNEIEENLKREFPLADFGLYAVPAIFVSTALYERIRSSVPGSLSISTQVEK